MNRPTDYQMKFTRIFEDIKREAEERKKRNGQNCYSDRPRHINNNIFCNTVFIILPDKNRKVA